MLTRSKDFLDFLRPSSFDGKGAKNTNKVAYIGAASIENTCIMDTCAKSTSAEDISSAKDICVQDAFVRGVYIEDTCVRDINTVKYLEIHS